MSKIKVEVEIASEGDAKVAYIDLPPDLDASIVVVKARNKQHIRVERYSAQEVSNGK